MSERESQLISSACDVRLLVQWHRLSPHLENGGTRASLTRLSRALENLENGGTGASLTRLPHALEHAGEELESKVVASTRSEATLPGPESSLCFMPAP